MGYIGHIDVINDFEISGWASDHIDKKKRILIDIIVNGRRVATCEASHFRDDLLAVGVSDGYSAFSYISKESLDLANNQIQIVFSGTRISVPREKTDSEKKKRFEDYIFPMLKCIGCEDTQLSHDDKKITCRKCGSEYKVYHYIPIMVPGTDTEKVFNYSNDVVAKTCYSDELIDLILKYGHGPVLDLGSGYNANIFPDLGTVKLDIFPLQNVDVVAYGERLPFRHETFEAVISMSAFEHVQNPFLLINNINKVLVPGGEVFIETAFLQPVHAFPDHYFNMTKQGLEYLCADFEKIMSGVQPHQFPSFALKWILKSWANKLDGTAKEDFLNITVRDILDEYTKDSFSKRWMEDFSTVDMEELACGVYFHGRKKRLGTNF